VRIFLALALACGGAAEPPWVRCEYRCPGASRVIDGLHDEKGAEWRECDCPNGNAMIFRVVCPASTCELDRLAWEREDCPEEPPPATP